MQFFLLRRLKKALMALPVLYLSTWGRLELRLSLLQPRLHPERSLQEARPQRPRGRDPQGPTQLQALHPGGARAEESGRGRRLG